MGKHILLVNDIAGYSKVGMAAMMPVLSYMGHPAYSLPTALVSNTLDYGKFSIQDNTEFIRNTLPIWKELGFRYDAICTGLMFSKEEAELVEAYCREQSETGTLVFVDPVMGDGGRLYNGIDIESVGIMRRMVGVSHLTLPNYTEACYLTGMTYESKGMTWEQTCRMLDALRDLGAKSALITSCISEGMNGVAGYNHFSNEYFYLSYEEIPGIFHGTGDLFSAVLIGHLLNGKTLKDSTQRAMDTLSLLLEKNKDVSDKYRGIPIEKYFDLIQ